MAYSRNVFIGLGGSGQKALLEIKRSILESIPPEKEGRGLDAFPELAFIAFDTDEKVAPVQTSTGLDVQFSSTEWHHIDGKGAKKLAQNADWWPNGCSLWPRGALGANANRLHGRAKLSTEIKKVKNRIGTAIKQAKAASLSSEDGAINTRTTVWIVGSLAGGTGAGMWFDIANIVRAQLDTEGNDMLNSVFVTGDVFTSLVGTANVLTNTYGCLRELTWFQNGKQRELPTHYDLNRERIQYPDGDLFNLVLLATGTNENGATITTPDQLYQAIGRFLFLTAGSSGGAWASVYSNLMDHTFEVEPLGGGGSRMMSFSSMGIAEIVYDRSVQNKVGLYKDAQRLIDTGLRSGSPNAQKESNVEMVDRFLDKHNFEEEKHGADDLIDRLISPERIRKYGQRISRRVDFDDLSKSSAKAHSVTAEKVYRNSIASIKKEIEAAAEEITAGFDGLLRDAIGEFLFDEQQGTTRIESFLGHLSDKFSIYADMMLEESQAANKVADVLLNGFKAHKKEVGSKKLGNLFGGGWQNSVKADINSTNKKLESAIHKKAEYLRTKTAKEIFSSICQETKRKKVWFSEMEDQLLMSEKEFSKLGAVLGARKAESYYKQNVSFPEQGSTHDQKINFDLWAKELLQGLDGGIWRWLGSPSAKLIAEDVEKFVSTKTTSEKTVFDWFHEMEKTGKDGKRVIEKTLNMLETNSSPLWQLSDQSGAVAQELKTATFLGTQNSEALPTSLGKRFPEQIAKVTTGDSSRITLVRVTYAVPAFTLGEINAMENSYNNPSGALRKSNSTPHLDATWVDLLPTIFPSENIAESLKVWAQAMALGLIRTAPGNKFQVRNTIKRGDRGIDGQYSDYTLPNTGVAKAFKDFSNEQDLIEDVQDQVVDHQTRNGSEDLNNLLSTYAKELRL
ncbi:MAG: hypothetical protein GY879_13425, partial [Planctomycetes bacterium]|nr:hypothetical protein [Planctomycetota bacterium]